MRTNTLFLFFLFLIFLSSCSNDELVYDAIATSLESRAPLMVKSVADPGAYIAGIVFNAENADDIPDYCFYTEEEYRTAYRHLKQRTGECSWTAYVCGMGAVTNGIAQKQNLSVYYPITKDKVTEVKTYCENRAAGFSAPRVERFPTFVGHLNHYSWVDYQQYFYTSYCDFNTSEVGVSYDKSDPAARFRAIKFLLKHLANHHTPCVALAATSSTDSRGHYYLIWEVTWKQGGVGSTIIYTDVASGSDNQNFTSSMKAKTLTEFLDLMESNADASLYNIFGFIPNRWWDVY